MQLNWLLFLANTNDLVNTSPMDLLKTQPIVVAQTTQTPPKERTISDYTEISIIILLVLVLVGVVFRKPLFSLPVPFLRKLSGKYQKGFAVPIKLSNVRAKDYLRAEIQGIVYVDIKDETKATSLQTEEGEFTDDNILKHMIEATMRQVASQKNLEDIYKERQKFCKEVVDLLSDKKNESVKSLGVSLNHVLIATIDESNTYNPENYFDVQALEKRTRTIQEAMLATRDAELDIKPEIRQKELDIELATLIEEETKKPAIREKELEIERQIREKELEIEKKIETKELEFQQNHLANNNTLETSKIKCELDIEKHRSISETKLEQEIEQVELNTTKEIETYRAKIEAEIQKFQDHQAADIQLAKIIKETEVAHANKKFQILQAQHRAEIEVEIQKSQDQQVADIQLAKIEKDTEVAHANQDFQILQAKLQQEVETEEIQGVIEILEKEKEKLTKEKERAEALEAITTAIEEARAQRVNSEAQIIKTLAEAEEIRYKAVPINDVDRMVKLIRDALMSKDSKLKEIKDVVQALAPQPGVLGNSSIYTFANGNGEDIHKLMLSTSGIKLIQSLLDGKLGTMLEQTLADNNNGQDENE